MGDMRSYRAARERYKVTERYQEAMKRHYRETRMRLIIF